MNTKEIITKNCHNWGVQITTHTNPPRHTISKEISFEDFGELESTLLGLSNAVICIGELLSLEMSTAQGNQIGSALESIGRLQNKLNLNGACDAMDELIKVE